MEEVTELIENVCFHIKPANGICVRCKEEGKILRVAALIYYPGKDIQGRACPIESKWSVDYCMYCINQIMEGSDDEKDVMFT